jgi:Tol biopolymer transport system component
MITGRLFLSLTALVLLQDVPISRQVDLTLTEGTSMAAAASPDGRSIAIDLLGGIWILPMRGGEAKRITPELLEARQPTWSPDSQSIAFQGYDDGTWHIYVIPRGGRTPKAITSGLFDDREPAWSHDGTRVAFSSDRGNPLGSDYNIWTLDVRSGELTQITKNPADDYMPSWSPDDKEIAFASSRDNQSVWIANLATGTEHKLGDAVGGHLDAPSWGGDGEIVYHKTTGGARNIALRDRRQDDHRRRERLRLPRLVGVADDVLLRVGRQDPQARRQGDGARDDRVLGDDAGDARGQ